AGSRLLSLDHSPRARRTLTPRFARNGANSRLSGDAGQCFHEWASSFSSFVSSGRGRMVERMRSDEHSMSASSETWPRPHRLTVDDYYRMAEVGVLGPDDRTELIEGEIIDMPPIGDRHADVVRILTKRLVQAAGDS